MKQGSIRLKLAAEPTLARDKLARVARHGLKLSDEEAVRLGEKLPLELTLIAIDAALQARLEKDLVAAGARALFSPHPIAFDRCRRHARLAASETCSKCGNRACAACTILSKGRVCARCTRRESFRRAFRRARIALLLAILAFVAFNAWHETRRISSWKSTLAIDVVPIVADDNAGVRAYVAKLERSAIDPIAGFIDREAKKRGVHLDPAAATVSLSPPIEEMPPAPPEEPNVPTTIAWSLNLRWWAWRIASKNGLPAADLRVFVLYHEAQPDRSLEHSVGIAKARIGIVHAFAAERAAGSNAVVIAHEVMHALGASDKYGPDLKPTVPEGIADPKRVPLYPQSRAEIMAGRIPISDRDLKIPDDLDQCIVGEKTATEIGWITE